MSLVKANTYQDASGGSNAVFSGVASPPNSMGFRNRIINGNMAIDQRNAGASVTPTADSTYTLDRWMARLGISSKFSVQQNAGSVTPPTGFSNYLGITSLAATTVASGDYYGIQQSIEGFNVSDLGWGTASAQSVTLSFQVRSSLTGTFSGVLKNSGFNRSYPFTFTISSANTWETKTITIAGDTSGTWLSNNGIGIQVIFNLGYGSSLLGTAGVWAASNLGGATGSVNVVSTNGATFYITGVQLEAGTNASAFEQIDYGRELIMCQRYYEVSESGTLSVSGSYTFIAYVAGETNGLRFTVTKRAAPTVTLYNTSGTSGQIGGNTNAATAGYIGTNGFGYIGRSGNTVGAGYYGHFAASAEL
jgi:hypothetical protein